MKTQIIGRSLGFCPFCKACDTLVIGGPYPLNTICICTNCESAFDVYKLLISEIKRNCPHILSMLEITAWQSITLVLPVKWQMPFFSVIAEYMKAAARIVWNAEITKEKEVSYCSCKKMWIKEYEFILGFERPIVKNTAPARGSPTYDISPLFKLDERYKSFFSWLEKFMKLLFVDDLHYKGVPFGRGSILKLSEKRLMHEQLSRFYLYCALLSSMEDDKDVDRRFRKGRHRYPQYDNKKP